MFGVEVCELAKTGGSTAFVVAGLFMMVIGYVVARWMRRSSGRFSVVVAPLVLLGVLAYAPQAGQCSTTSSTVASVTTIASVTTVASVSTSIAAPTTTVPADSSPTTVANSSPTTVAESTTTTLAASICSIGDCAIGDIGPGGGTIFYIDLNRPSGSQYFEVACAGWSDGTCGGSDIDPKAQWGCDGVAPLVVGSEIGDGESNTTTLVTNCANSTFPRNCYSAGCNNTTIAAVLARNYVGGGFTNWSLPSKGEMNKLCMWVTNRLDLDPCGVATPKPQMQNINGGLYFPGGPATAYWSSSVGSGIVNSVDITGRPYEMEIPAGNWEGAIRIDDHVRIRPIRAF